MPYWLVNNPWLQHCEVNNANLRKAFACSTTPILIGYDLTLIGFIIANSKFVQQFGLR